MSKWQFRLTSIFIAATVVASLVFMYVHVGVKAENGSISIAITNTQVLAQEPQVGEQLDKRTRSSKTTYLGGGVYALDTIIGAVHYLDNGQWVEIDPALVPASAPYAWQMTDAGYQVYLMSEFDAGQIARFAKNGNYIEFQPMALELVNELEQIQPWAMPEAVNPVVSNPVVQDMLPGYSPHVGTIEWLDAYGPNVDFKWETTNTRLNKTITIAGLSDIPVPEPYMGSNVSLRFNMIFDPSSNLDIYVNGVLWDKKSKVQTFDNIYFIDHTSQEVLWSFMPLLYWDSGGNYGQSVANLEKRGNKLYITIRVPYSWIQAATFPIFLDTDVDEQISTNTVNDGEVYGASQGSGGSYSTYVTQFGASATSLYNFWAFFDSVTISGGTIGVAYLTFTADTTRNNDDVFVRIWADDTGTPTAPANAAAYWALTKTTNYTDWDNVPHWTKNSEYDSPSLVDVVQELIDSYDYSGGLSMQFFGWDNGSTHVSYTTRSCYDYGVNSAKAMKLHIEYSAGGTPEIGVSPAIYDFGVVAESATPYTATDYFTLSNNSTIQTDMTIGVVTENWTGGIDWIHDDTGTPGADTVALLANQDGTWGVDDIVVMWANPDFIYENCPASTNFTFGLKLLAPTSFSDGVEKENTVRIFAAAG